jgi:homoserine kinase
MQQVAVRVPASTSNLGPGFDCLGVALRLYNKITVARGRPSQIPPIVEEAGNFFFRRTRQRPFPFFCSTVEQVPRMRGLGSSATIRLGVLAGLNQLSDASLDRFSIFRLCAELEGHPDNAAPSSFGGFTVARTVSLQCFVVSSRLYFVLLIPDFEIRTANARKVLPKRPFRTKLIPILPRVIDAGQKAGALGAFLSGSGSTICAVSLQNPRKVAMAMQRAAKSKSAKTIITTADHRGVQILKR